MGPGTFFELSWVSHLWIGFGKFPLKNPKFFNFFCMGQKRISSVMGQKVPGSNTGRPLIYCGSKVCSGWVELGQSLSLVAGKTRLGSNLESWVLGFTWIIHH